jgi:hypothetical protein
MQLGADSKIILSIATFMDLSEEDALSFYESVAQQFTPKPSLYAFAFWLRQGYQDGMKVEDFVSYLIQNDHSLKKRWETPISLPSVLLQNKSDPNLGSPSTNIKSRGRKKRRPNKSKYASRTIPGKLTDEVAQILPGEDRGNTNAAKLFLLYMRRIYPKDFINEELLLKAIKKCKRYKELTVDNVHDCLRLIKDPDADRISIISVPMSNRK